MQACTQTGRRTPSTASQFSETQADASGREAERGLNVSYPAEPSRGGLWAGWQITGHSCCHGDCRGWQRWITHQRSSVNHQSPLTSHYRHWCPPTPPTPCTHTYTHTLTHISSGWAAKSHSGWVLLTNQPKVCENAAPSYTPLPSTSRSLLSLSFLSLPHFTSTVISVSALCFVTYSSLTFFLPVSLHLCFLPVTEFISTL